MAEISRIIQMFQDQINTVGVVRRIYFHALYEFTDGTKEWWYFGTDPTEAGKQPTTGDPVTEVTYTQVPNDLDNVPKWQGDILFYDLGQLAGEHREGLR